MSIVSSGMSAMTRPQARKHIRTGNISEKIMAKATFDLELISQISTDQRPRIQKEGLRYLSKYFSAYVDHMARVNHSKYHHLYEPGFAGNEKYRLFRSNITEAKTPKLEYNFIQSKIPPDSGYVFQNRAYVMENGIPLTIKASSGKMLRFQYKGKFYTKKQVYVAQPGGPDVAGSFAEIFYDFMTGMAMNALREYGFFERIEKGIEKESRIALARISSGRISGMASEAAKAATRIARGI